jgi:hypothetical protein
MKVPVLIVILMLALGACNLPSVRRVTVSPAALLSPTATLKPSRTPTRTATLPPSATSTAAPPTETATPTVEATFTITPTATPPFTSARTQTATPTQTKEASATPTATETPTPEPTLVSVAPFPDAPLCEDHENSIFHTLWNEQEGCHYDHEHGQNPFTDDVASAFPGYDLKSLLGGVGVGHTNPSSGMENTHKHGGFKWSVNLTHLSGCTPFEGARNGVDASAILFHGMGDYGVELEASVHSTAALLRFCGDEPGYMYTVQHITYGQVVVPYQGPYVAPYPHAPQPPYNAGLGPYISVDCVGPVIQCRSSLDFIRSRNLDANSYWTAKSTGSGTRPENSMLFRPFFRLRDAYQVFDWTDQTHPFTYLWVCSSDGGATYDPAGCDYNNSTTQIHEIAGVIPSEWDNLTGWDTNPDVGLVSAEGIVTRYGTRNTACTEAGEDCHPIVLVNVPTGSYGSLVMNYPSTKLPANTEPLLPERDVYFCNGVACGERDSGAVSSSWIMGGN